VKDDNKPIMTRFGRIVRPVQIYINVTLSPTEAHATNLKNLRLLKDRKNYPKVIEEEIDNLMASWE
jgi:hypothetical protein